MITDALLIFSDNQTVSGSTTSSDNTLDLGPLTHGNTERDIGSGEPVYLVVYGTSGMTTGTATITLKTGNSELATDTVLSKTNIALATLADGQPMLAIVIPRGIKRYLKVEYVFSGASGNIWAGIVKDIHDVKSYASAFEVA